MSHEHLIMATKIALVIVVLAGVMTANYDEWR